MLWTGSKSLSKIQGLQGRWRYNKGWIKK